MATNFSPTDFPITLPDGIGDQSTRLYLALREAILAGRLAKGARLPASRTLAQQMGVRRNSVVAAYERLLSEELAEARQGSGTYVAMNLPLPTRQTVQSHSTPQQVTSHVESRPFDLGMTSVDDAVLEDLRRAMTRCIRRLKSTDLGYGDPRGLPELRSILAQHIATTRGVLCHPDQIMIVAGTQLGLHLSLRAIEAEGKAGWIENPGYPSAQRAFVSAGVRAIPVPVDAQGLDVTTGLERAPKAHLAYVTPSHQFPTGVVMSMARRIALLDWASQTGAWILEDDYDSEFRYSGPPLTALAGIDQAGRVIYIGTFSKTLFPGLRLGYVVAPENIITRMTTLRQTVDRFSPTLEQSAMADLLSSGALSRHINRMRSKYRDVRDLIVPELRDSGGGLWNVTCPEQGLHLVAQLNRPVPKALLQQVQKRANIGGRLLSDTALEPLEKDGFALGFSGQGPKTLIKSARNLGEAAQKILK